MNRRVMVSGFLGLSLAGIQVAVPAAVNPSPSKAAQPVIQDVSVPLGAGRGLISLPDRTWGVFFDLTGFTIKNNELKPDGRKYLVAENSTTNVIFSVFLEAVDPGVKGKTCEENQRVRLKEPAPYARKEEKLYPQGEFFIAEFLVPDWQGKKVQQQNLFACAFHDNVYIDVHLSKVAFQPGEERYFRAVLDSFSYREGLVRTSMDYLVAGSRYYLQRNYKRAIPDYAQALELEKTRPQLERKFWYVLVDNLGMSYGITGDLEKSRETFEYGISKDPDYPLFYYNLACYFGEKGDSENAGLYLRKAFERRNHALPGESVPDPRKDDSFKKLLENSEFRKLVNALVSGS